MRAHLVLCAAAALAAGSIGSAAAQNAALTDKMAPFSYLLGSAWNCDVSVPAMMGQAAHREKTTVTFEVAPGNVMHVHIASPNMTGDQYFGYSTRQNMYWSTNANSMGQALTQTSSDGKTYTGSASMGPTSVTVRDTYTRVADNHVTFTDAATVNGQNYVTTGDCTH
jgi:hypothetical protein